MSAASTGTPVVVCEYRAVLHRSDLGGLFRRRYVAVLTVRGRRIAHLREHAGPLVPLPR